MQNKRHFFNQPVRPPEISPKAAHHRRKKRLLILDVAAAMGGELDIPQLSKETNTPISLVYYFLKHQKGPREL